VLFHTDAYILSCLRLEILTMDKIRAYPLRKGSLAAVLKAYAIASYLPYELNMQHVKHMPNKPYYLTESGFEWLIDVFSGKTLEYLRHTFGVMFAKATEADVKNPRYEGYHNFAGIIGDRPKAGTKRKAILVRKVRRVERTWEFENLREARKELLLLLRFYPVSEFTLYRIHKQGYRVKVPLILESNDRGAHLRK